MSNLELPLCLPVVGLSYDENNKAEQLSNSPPVEDVDKTNNQLEFSIVEEISEDWTIMDICQKRAPSGWEDVFKFAEPELKEISEILENQEAAYGNFFPLKRNIFKAFEITPLTQVRVVILGQDPYHDTTNNGPRAQGLSFSVSESSNIPPSLRNIFKEIKNEYPDSFDSPQHGDLSIWAYQGVLLLNTCLTVRPNAAGSHKLIWNGFIVKVIQAINSVNPNCIYVLWGEKAQNLQSFIGGKVKILKSSHPSPFSVNKGFYGCGHFKEINRILYELDGSQINWNLPKIFSV